MDVVFARCAGIAVHKRLVVVCRLPVDATGQRLAQTRTFGTTTSDLLHLSDWLAEGVDMLHACGPGEHGGLLEADL